VGVKGNRLCVKMNWIDVACGALTSGCGCKNASEWCIDGKNRVKHKEVITSWAHDFQVMNYYKELKILLYLMKNTTLL
jgi:hypothetical protein